MWLFLIPTLLCVIIAYLLVLASKQSATNKKVVQRLGLELPLNNGYSDVNSKLSKYTQTITGILSNFFEFNFKSEWVGNYMLITSTISIVSLLIIGYKVAAIITIAPMIVLIIYFIYRKNKYKQLMISQMPLFIDQLIRSLGTGRSLESAIRLVSNETPAPLGSLLDKVVRAADLGAGFTESLVKEATLHHIKELQIVALSIKVSNSYGSSPKEMLNSVMQMINNQDQASRELAAITGETKVSALILTLTPIAILLYMMVMNPGYLDMMLANPSGIKIFWVTISMQVIGALLFWRMLKSL